MRDIAAVWDLKGYVEKHHRIATAVQLQAFIEERVGVTVTVQTLRALLRNTPPAPRGEMIQLLCDAFNCRSDAFYVFTANPARARQWAKDRSNGKSPSSLYQPKLAERIEEVVKQPPETVRADVTKKPKPLRATFSDPRTLYKDTLRSRE